MQDVANYVALMVHRPNSPTFPPCDHEFYRKFYQELHESRVRYDAHTVRQLAAGLGLNDHERDALLQKAMTLLPDGPAVRMNSIAGRRTKDEGAAGLLADNQFARYFVHAFPARYELAIKFFADAPKRWIMAANDRRRREQGQANADMQGGQQAAVRGWRWRDVTSQPGTPGRYANFENAIEIRDMTTGQLASSCLNDILNTGENTPAAADLNMRTICAWWNLHLGRPNALDVHRFIFYYQDEAQAYQPWYVIDDGSLRYAWRLWLSLGDVEMPFVLVVANGDDD